jgi:mercuric ion transport protein
MKKLIIIIPIVLAMGYNSCNSPQSKETNQTQEVIAPSIAEIDVEGMTCSGCENTVNKSVSGLDGIVEVNSSHVDKKTVVKYDPEKTTLEEIKEAITKVGYQVVEPQTTE